MCPRVTHRNSLLAHDRSIIHKKVQKNLIRILLTETILNFEIALQIEVYMKKRRCLIELFLLFFQISCDKAKKIDRW